MIYERGLILKIGKFEQKYAIKIKNGFVFKLVFMQVR